MPQFGACCLSSCNLSAYVKNAFSPDAYFDFQEFKEDMRTYVKSADKIVDESAHLHALPEQKTFALNYRNIGIGIMGLGTMFIKLGIRFGSQKSIQLASDIMDAMFRAAVFASSELATKLGSFPKYNEAVFNSTIIKNHFSDEEIKQLKKQGLRNSSLLSIAPTGLN